MNLCGLDGSCFIISLALILLILGGLVFYSLQRFAIVENSIIQQGRILHSFITRMEQSGGHNSNPGNSNSCANCQCAPGQCKCASGQCSNQLATELAITSAKEQLSKPVSDKIEVSDNEDSDSESDSDADSNSGSDSSDDFKLNLKDISDIKDLDLVGVTDIQELGPDIQKHVTDIQELGPDIQDLTDVKIVAIELEPNSNGFGFGIGLDLDFGLNLNNTLELNFEKCRDYSDSDSGSESEIGLNDLIQDITDDIIDKKPDKPDKPDKIKKDFSKMKVNELRELAVQKNLVESLDLANKIKKDALIKLLN